MFGCQHHDNAVPGKFCEFPPDKIFDIQALRGSAEVESLALLAVIQREIALTGKADDHLLEIMMSMATADGILLGAPDIVDAFDIEIEILPLLQSDEVAGVIAMNFEIFQFVHAIMCGPFC